MKKLVSLGLLLILLGLTYSYKEDIIKIYNRVFVDLKKDSVKLESVNKYYRKYDFQYVQNTTDFTPSSKQDILNIYYTVINAGKDKFTFYCPTDYEECLEDVDYLANDQTTLSHINNYVHPFNGFKNVETEYDSLGKVTIHVHKSYTDAEISELETKIDQISNEVIKSDLKVEDNIRNVHDYIINHSKYDSDRSDRNIVNYKSDLAYGPLMEGYGLCGGYTDAMELFLEKLGVRSYKVSSENHVWNAVYLDNSWKHLDLTWDDPVTNTGADILEHNFFLITTDQLKQLGTNQHSFDLTVYKEFS